MPDLYRLHIGPVRAAYYQRQFQRFESKGKPTLSWNHGAAFFSLAWLLLRKLWLPAGIYAATLLTLLMLWGWGLHGQVPLTTELSVCAFALLCICVVPGCIGNGLYYQQVRRQTLQTLASATSLGQARAQLAENAVHKTRWHAVATIQALTAVGISVAALLHAANHHPNIKAPTAVSSTAWSPPDLEIPLTPNLPPLELQPFTPGAALSSIEAATPSAKAAFPPPAVTTSSALTSMVEIAPSDAATGPAAEPTPAISLPTDEASTQAAHPAVDVPAGTQQTVSAAAAPGKTADKPKVQLQAATKQAVTRLSKGPFDASKYYLNAGVYAQPANVEAAAKKLHAAKLQTVRQSISSKNGEMTRLRIGPFETRKQAEQAAAKAQTMRIETSLVAPSKP